MTIKYIVTRFHPTHNGRGEFTHFYRHGDQNWTGNRAEAHEFSTLAEAVACFEHQRDNNPEGLRIETNLDAVHI